MNIHFFQHPLPAKGIITNLTICQSDGGELRAHCYFNFHFPNCSKTEFAAVIVFSMNCFYIHCSSFHGIIYPIFHSFVGTVCILLKLSIHLTYIMQMYFLIYYLSFNVICNVFGLPKNCTMYIVTYIYFFLDCF